MNNNFSTIAKLYLIFKFLNIIINNITKTKDLNLWFFIFINIIENNYYSITQTSGICSPVV